MKLHQLAKKYELNFNDFKKHIQKHGFLAYKSPNKRILDTDLEALEELAANFTQTQQKLSAEKLEKRKGKYVGIVYDRKNGCFKSVVVKASYRELVEAGIEFEVLDEHGSIFSAMLMVNKKVGIEVNQHTVHKYGGKEE
jgi:hypothetical protein